MTSDPRVTRVAGVVLPWCSTQEEADALAVSIVSALYPSEASQETGLSPGGNHALLVGRLCGLMMKDDGEQRSSGSQRFFPLEPQPVMTTKGDYTNKIVVTQPSGAYVITVEDAAF